MPTAGEEAALIRPAPLGLSQIRGRLISALDYWIIFNDRLARRRAPWVVFHRLLSVPLFLRIGQHALELEQGGEPMRMRCRAHSPRLGGLLPQAAVGGTDARGTADAEPDLDVVQVHPWVAPWWRRRGWLTVPAFVRYRADLDSVPPAHRSKSLRSNLAKARRNGFRPRPGDDADWERARAMAEAWARARFGSDVWLPPQHAWGRIRRHGRVIMVGDGARDVAMATLVSADRRGEAWLGPIGIAAGDHALLRAGALTAAYAAAVEEARRLGASTFDSGRCSALADDPIAAYKRRWGFRPTADRLSPLYAFRARTPAGERWLASLPLWALGPGGELHRVGPR